MLKNIVKGDSINLEATLNQDITDWKIRCELSDSKSNRIKLATLNSGGNDDQIEVIDLASGTFIIHVAKDLTNCFYTNAFIEIEVENADNEIYTVYQDDIQFKRQQIDWTAP